MRYHKFEMRAKKNLVFVLLPLFLGSFLYSQTLAEIAQKERERRENLKGKKAKVVTNADLAKLKKKPALVILVAPGPPQAAEKAETTQALPLPAQGAPEQSEPAEAIPENKSQAALQDLQQRWEKAKEYVELLTLKMSALWQAYNGLDATTPKEALKQSISETFIKLENAQEEEAKARQALEKFLGQAKKESTPSIWIR
jgi:hypothetical protein